MCESRVVLLFDKRQVLFNHLIGKLASAFLALLHFGVLEVDVKVYLHDYDDSFFALRVHHEYNNMDFLSIHTKVHLLT